MPKKWYNKVSTSVLKYMKLELCRDNKKVDKIFKILDSSVKKIWVTSFLP